MLSLETMSSTVSFRTLKQEGINPNQYTILYCFISCLSAIYQRSEEVLVEKPYNNPFLHQCCACNIQSVTFNREISTRSTTLASFRSRLPCGRASRQFMASCVRVTDEIRSSSVDTNGANEGYIWIWIFSARNPNTNEKLTGTICPNEGVIAVKRAWFPGIWAYFSSVFRTSITRFNDAADSGRRYWIQI